MEGDVPVLVQPFLPPTHWRALLALFEGDLPEAIGLYGRSIEIHRSVGDLAAELTAAFQLAMAQAYLGHSEVGPADLPGHPRRELRSR